jgi:hypothetical protein
LAGDLSSAEVPPTVAALLAARLDRLPAEQRTFAEQVSVVGLDMTEEDAVVLSGQVPAEVRELLAALGRRDLLRRRRTEHGEEWSFKHILVRDSAYESLPKAMRAELHERYADHVAASGDEAAGERAAFVAHHLELALLNRVDLGQTTANVVTLADRAAGALIDASRAASDRLDIPAATRLLDRATELDQAPRATRREAMLRRLGLLFLSQQVHRLDPAIDRYARLVEDPPDGLELKLVPLLRLWRDLQSEPVDPRLIYEAADRVREEAAKTGDILVQALALAALMDAEATLGIWSTLADRALEQTKLGSTLPLRSVAISRVTSVLHGVAPLGRLWAEIDLQRAVESRTPVEELVLQSTEALAAAAAEHESYDEALGRLLAQYDERPDRQMPIIMGTFAQQLAGDISGARKSIERLIDMMEARGDVGHASTQLGEWACFELYRGDPDDRGVSLTDRAEAVTSPYDTVSVGLVAAARCMLAARSGDSAEAARQGEHAIATLRLGDQLWTQADVHRYIALSRRWVGDADGERAQLEQSRELYRRKEISFWTRHVEERLTELL